MKLALAVLLIFTLPVQAPALAEELSPWFGSQEGTPFQLEMASVPTQSGRPAKESRLEPNCERGICPGTVKLAIEETQGLAAAP